METGRAQLDASRRYCRRVTRQASSTFYLASQMFSKATRNDLCAVYAFCRIADDIADAPGLKPSERKQELDLLAHTLRAKRYSEGDLLWPAFFDVVQRYAIPERYFSELLKGVGRDIEPFTLRSITDLDDYSYLVAGTVGCMCAYILGKPSTKMLSGAKELGIAMQYTNIMRDVSADSSLARVYLPSELMARHGLSREDILTAQNPDALAVVLSDLSKLARAKYDRAESAIALLDHKNRRPVRIAFNLYRGILMRIEQNHFNVYNKRIRLSLPLKVWVAITTR